jgi:hypothetical protein
MLSRLETADSQPMNQKLVGFAVWMHHAHEGVVTAISQKIAEIEYRISSAELCSDKSL